MHILAHRGIWETPAEQNTVAALTRAFEAGFGIETDVRDCGGRLVISHDPPTGGEPDFAACLAPLHGMPLPVAINIKADGLGEAVGRLCRRYRVPDWFVFDMSIPDMRQQLACGNPVYARMSEVERIPPWQDQFAGLWLDGFGELWYDADILANLLGQFRVCVVSQELHGRGHSSQWAMLAPFAACETLLLCTDLPGQAQQYFRSRA